MFLSSDLAVCRQVEEEPVNDSLFILSRLIVSRPRVSESAVLAATGRCKLVRQLLTGIPRPRRHQWSWQVTVRMRVSQLPRETQTRLHLWLQEVS